MKMHVCVLWILFERSNYILNRFHFAGHKGQILNFPIAGIQFNLIFHLYLYPSELVDQLSYIFEIYGVFD